MIMMWRMARMATWNVGSEETSLSSLSYYLVELAPVANRIGVPGAF